MCNIQFNEIKEALKNSLDPLRYEHTLGVMYTAASLAMAYDYSVEKAMLAGLLHDCAKCIPNHEKVALCQKYHVAISKCEMENQSLLHAKAGAICAKEWYHVEDSEVLHAIQIHTTGEAEMNLLDKIIYVADYIEPNRTQAPNLKYLRKIAYQDINKCIAYITQDTLLYLEEKKGSIDPATQLTYEFYRHYKED